MTHRLICFKFQSYTDTFLQVLTVQGEYAADPVACVNCPADYFMEGTSTFPSTCVQCPAKTTTNTVRMGGNVMCCTYSICL